MDISRNRFPFELVKIMTIIADSHFIAFDCEFSGVASHRKPRTGAGRKKLTLQELYDDLKAAAEKYQILQVGLTVVQEDLENGKWTSLEREKRMSRPLTQI